MPTSLAREGTVERRLYDHLLEGDGAGAAEVFVFQYQEGKSTAELGDTLVKPVFDTFGDSWENETIEIYREHRATEIMRSILSRRRSELPHPKQPAPTAIGCTPERDFYVLPTLIVDISLRELGWRTDSLGTNLPIDSLCSAIRDLRPDLCWISVSHLEDPRRFVRDCETLQRVAAEQNAEVVLGGRALGQGLRRALPPFRFFDTVTELMTVLGPRR